MGGCRCSYKSCKNTTKTTENVHFFHYPVKHKERCKLWIENANKPHFCDLEEDQLRNKVICELHFEDRWFPNSQKKRLIQGAVPTLDAGSVDEPQITEGPLYLSPQLQDVQILPANSDGTIFVLDTDTMFNRSQKVESYIYKNGVIVPANKQKSSFASKASPSVINSTYSSFKKDGREPMPNSSRTFEGQARNVTGDASDYKVVIKKEIPDYSGTTQEDTSQSLEQEMEELNYENQDQEQMYKIQNSNFSQKRVISRSANTKNVLAKGMLDKSVGRNYLRKIKQHSRDIASIKRMLKQKVLAEGKPDVTAALGAMKDQLPQTFFTILNLNLNNKWDLTDDDVDFFTTIHKTSPEVYQLLIDKYKWNLPCVDIVESTME